MSTIHTSGSRGRSGSSARHNGASGAGSTAQGLEEGDGHGPGPEGARRRLVGIDGDLGLDVAGSRDRGAGQGRHGGECCD